MCRQENADVSRMQSHAWFMERDEAGVWSEIVLRLAGHAWRLSTGLSAEGQDRGNQALLRTMEEIENGARGLSVNTVIGSGREGHSVGTNLWSLNTHHVGNRCYGVLTKTLTSRWSWYFR